MKIHNTEINLKGMELSKSDHKVPNRQYEMANDQHVRNIVLYADSAKKLYVDEAKTSGIKKDELIRLFQINSILVATANGLEKPTSLTIGDTYTTVTAGETSYFSVEKA